MEAQLRMALKNSHTFLGNFNNVEFRNKICLELGPLGPILQILAQVLGVSLAKTAFLSCS